MCEHLLLEKSVKFHCRFEHQVINSLLCTSGKEDWAFLRVKARDYFGDETTWATIAMG